MNLDFENNKDENALRKQGHSMFKKDNSKKELIDKVSDMSAQVNILGRRVRVVEERITSSNRKSQVTEQNMIDGFKKTTKATHAVNDEILELKKEFEKLKMTMELIIKELR